MFLIVLLRFSELRGISADMGYQIKQRKSDIIFDV